MSLPDTYLDYPNRRHGQDIDRYDWRLSVDRPPVAWPARADGAAPAVALMVVVPVEFHMLTPSGKPFRHPGAMQTPYPDLRHYTTRDYGNRVGIYRNLDALAASGIRATVPVNAVMLERAPPLVEALIEGGHEIAAHGWDTDSIHWSGLAEEAERALVARTRAAFTARGLAPVTWMSPARQQSARTPDLLREAGFTVCLDWEMDAVPVAMRTTTGPLACVPLLNELDDRKLLIDQRQDEDSWVAQILAARDLMVEEAPRFGGQVLSFTLTPYISGQPFRTAPLRRLLSALASDPEVWSATARDIAAAGLAAG
jgi:allantoinase